MTRPAFPLFIINERALKTPHLCTSFFLSEEKTHDWSNPGQKLGHLCAVCRRIPTIGTHTHTQNKNTYYQTCIMMYPRFWTAFWQAFRARLSIPQITYVVLDVLSRLCFPASRQIALASWTDGNPIRHPIYIFSRKCHLSWAT